MQAVLNTIRRLLGKEGAERPATQLIAPTEHLKHSEQNLQAIHSVIEANQDIVFAETLDFNGVLTAVEIHADRIHVTNHQTKQNRLIRLDDSLESYHELDEELRFQLALRIAKLAPTLAYSKTTLALDHAVKVLKSIARDQTERVRYMIAQELADLPDAPYDVIRQLACDASHKVACPILEFSPLLRDDDLIDILSTCNVPGVAESIARRRTVSESVSDAIVKTKHPDAIHALLLNEQSHLSSGALATIVNEAPDYEIWHESLIHRPELTQKTVNRIAGFISSHLLLELEERRNLKLVHKQDTRAAVQHRLTSWTAEQERAAELKARHYYDAGKLDEERLSDAIHAADEPFVCAALSLMCQIPKDTIKRILRSQSGKAITSLAWEANLSMRTAMALQMKIGRVHHTKMIHARGGFDYPIPEAEMQTYLEIYTG